MGDTVSTTVEHLLVPSETHCPSEEKRLHVCNVGELTCGLGFLILLLTWESWPLEEE